MKSPVVKRSIVIAGHKTSVSLEDAFWKGLKEIAIARQVTLSDLVASIDTGAPARQSVVGDPAVRAGSLSGAEQSPTIEAGRRGAAAARNHADAAAQSVGVAGGIAGLRRSAVRTENLAGIEDVERVERALDRAHGVERRLAVLGQEIFHLALADAVLAGAGAVHRQRALDQPFEQMPRRA